MTSLTKWLTFKRPLILKVIAPKLLQEFFLWLLHCRLKNCPYHASNNPFLLVDPPKAVHLQSFTCILNFGPRNSLIPQEIGRSSLREDLLMHQLLFVSKNRMNSIKKIFCFILWLLSVTIKIYNSLKTTSFL